MAHDPVVHEQPSPPGDDSFPLAVVCGATGYLGGHMVDALAAAGWRVRALARDPRKMGERSKRCAEVFAGEATRPETLQGLFAGATLAYSSIGIRHIHRKPAFQQVDYQANCDLIDQARAAGVRQFVFVSVFGGDDLRGELELAEARERAADHLRESGMNWIVVRPTGLFNDMAEFFEMARSGRVWLPGGGRARLNPIHAADVAGAVLSRMAEGGWNTALPCGGPDTFSLREIGELAFEAAGRRHRFTSVPVGLIRGLGKLARPFNANAGALLSGFAAMMEHGAVAPSYGSHHLRAFFEELASSRRRETKPEVSGPQGS